MRDQKCFKVLHKTEKQNDEMKALRPLCRSMLAFLLLICLSSQSDSGRCEIRGKDGHVRPHKVLVFMDGSYLKLFQNWMIYYDNVCGDGMRNGYVNLELVCMDASPAAELTAMGLRCSSAHSSIVHKLTATESKYSHSMRRSNVWLKRLEIILDLLRAGSDLVLSDTDALWMRNPYSHLSKHAVTSSIVASRGWFPQALSKRWGSILCMGFVYARADPFTVSFFQSVLEQMKDTYRAQMEFNHWSARGGSNDSLSSTFNLSAWNSRESHTVDDQHAVNNQLFVMDIVWPVDMPHSARSVAHVGVVLADGVKQRITLLPENDFLRNCAGLPAKLMERMILATTEVLKSISERVGNATIAHCLTPPGNSSRKENFLALYSLWRLPHNLTAAKESIHEDVRAMNKLSRIRVGKRRSERLAAEAEKRRQERAETAGNK